MDKIRIALFILILAAVVATGNTSQTRRSRNLRSRNSYRRRSRLSSRQSDRSSDVSNDENDNKSFNVNSVPPPHLTAHVYMHANGSVPISPGENAFANNAIDGTNFLLNEMGFTEEEIDEYEQKAINFWRDHFGADARKIVKDKNGQMLRYQIAPAVNERIFLATQPCPIPAEGFPVLDGGFQLLITNPDGINVRDPKNNGRIKHLTFLTNFVYAWQRVNISNGRQPCNRRTPTGSPPPAPAVIIIPYQTRSTTQWTLEYVPISLSIRAGNYFGEGVSIGQSAPVLDAGKIINRLNQYIEITGPFITSNARNIY